MPENVPSPEPGDIAFRRIASVSTAASLALAYGWLAGFVRQPNGDLIFHWRWLVLVWALIGYFSAVYFWRKIWPPGNQNATRGGVVKGIIALAIPGSWWLIFPLRSQSGQHLWQVVTGLSAAAVVLSFGTWMIVRLVKAFEDDKEAE